MRLLKVNQLFLGRLLRRSGQTEGWRRVSGLAERVATQSWILILFTRLAHFWRFLLTVLLVQVSVSARVLHGHVLRLAGRVARHDVSSHARCIVLLRVESHSV